MPETTCIYARVSTADQSLDGQKQDCWEYCTDDLGIAPRNIHVIEDESTGMDTEREGYQELIDLADEDDVLPGRQRPHHQPWIAVDHLVEVVLQMLLTVLHLLEVLDFALPPAKADQ